MVTVNRLPDTGPPSCDPDPPDRPTGCSCTSARRFAPRPATNSATGPAGRCRPRRAHRVAPQHLKILPGPGRAPARRGAARFGRGLPGSRRPTPPRPARRRPTGSRVGTDARQRPGPTSCSWRHEARFATGAVERVSIRPASESATVASVNAPSRTNPIFRSNRAMD